MTRRTQRGGLALTVLILVLFVGCVTKTRVVTEEKLLFSMPPDSPPEQARDGLTVTVQMIHPENAASDPTIHKQMPFTFSDGKNPPVKRVLPLDLVPLPTFKVTIRNHTQYVLRLDRALLRLKDDVGNDYALMGKTELTAWMGAAFGKVQNTAAEQGMTVTLPQHDVANEYRTLKLINRDTEIPPEDAVTGYLAFDIPGQDSVAALAKWAKTVERLKLQLYQIPVETDAAGNVVKATKFEFTVKPKVEVTTRTEQYKALF